MHSRAPREHYEVYLSEAEDLGIPLSSWIELALCELKGLDVPDYITQEIHRAEERRRVEQTQEELPLAQAS